MLISRLQAQEGWYNYVLVWEPEKNGFYPNKLFGNPNGGEILTPTRRSQERAMADLKRINGEVMKARTAFDKAAAEQKAFLKV
jgi:hypothetical protein